MKRPMKTLAALLLALLALPAVADGEKRRASAPMPPAVAQECGGCHLAYPAWLLPAASWQALAGDLKHHYGSDASLDAATTGLIGSWLAANAANGKRARETPPEHRITRSAWFQREHREVAPAVWARPAVKSAANCGACHGGAAQGDFDEHAIHIPR
jgi:Dihaem cytochrome c